MYPERKKFMFSAFVDRKSRMCDFYDWVRLVRRAVFTGLNPFIENRSIGITQTIGIEINIRFIQIESPDIYIPVEELPKVDRGEYPVYRKQVMMMPAPKTVAQIYTINGQCNQRKTASKTNTDIANMKGSPIQSFFGFGFQKGNKMLFMLVYIIRYADQCKKQQNDQDSQYTQNDFDRSLHIEH
jgi:hypothetical protein